MRALAFFCIIAAYIVSVGSFADTPEQSRMDDRYSGTSESRQLYDRLRAAVKANDKLTVASLVHYPFGINEPLGKLHGVRTVDEIDSAEELVEKYDFVFTPMVREAILANDFSALESRGSYMRLNRVLLIGDPCISALEIFGRECDSEGPPTIKVVYIDAPERR